MSTRMELWQIDEGSGALTLLPRTAFPCEVDLEDMVEDHAEDLLGERLLVVARQPRTSENKLLDLLAIDGHGRLVVIENKKAVAKGDVVAQALDYAAWVHRLSLDDLRHIFSQYRHGRGSSDVHLLPAYERTFGSPLDRLATSPPRVLIVATEMDAQLESSITFLGEAHGIDIDAVLLQPFGNGLIARTSGWNAHRPTEAAAASFWSTWIPFAQPMLDPYVHLRSTASGNHMKKSLVHGIPGSLAVSLQSTTAKVRIELGRAADSDFHVVMMHQLMRRRELIEERFGRSLTWPDSASTTLQIDAGAIPIGQVADPTAVGLDLVARTSRDLVAAVMPFLTAAASEARQALASVPPTTDPASPKSTVDLREGAQRTV